MLSRSPEYAQGSDWPLCWRSLVRDAFGCGKLFSDCATQEAAMRNQKRFVIKLAMMLAVSVVGVLFVTGVDVRGTRWMTFIGYLIFFASILSPSILFSTSSCSILSRLLRRS